MCAFGHLKKNSFHNSDYFLHLSFVHSFLSGFSFIYFSLHSFVELTLYQTNFTPSMWIKTHCFFFWDFRIGYSERCISIIATTNLLFFSIDLICFSPIFCRRHRRNIIIACKFIANMYKQNNWHLSSTQHLLLKIINMFKAVCSALGCWSLTLPLNRHFVCARIVDIYATKLPCVKSSRWAHYHIWIKGAKNPYADSFSHYMHRTTKHISNCRKKWFFCSLVYIHFWDYSAKATRIQFSD